MKQVLAARCGVLFALLFPTTCAAATFTSILPPTGLPQIAVAGLLTQTTTSQARPTGVGEGNREGPTAGAGKGENSTKDGFPPLFYLKDGSKVAGNPTFLAIRVATRYGTLQVPTEELVRIHFAPRLEAALERKIEAQIARLESEDFKEREEATEALREIGSAAIPALRRAAGADNEETSGRAESLLEDIDSKESEEEDVSEEMAPSPDEHDVVVARRFTIRGRVLETKFSIRSRYGPLEFALSDVIGISFKYGERVSENVTVSGTKTVPSNWVNTKTQLFKGQRLHIRATGQLQLSRYNLTSGPAGSGRRSGNYMNFPSLALVGKIGKKGKAFLVGASYNDKARASGILYLGVVPYRTYAATGTYKVRIEGGK